MKIKLTIDIDTVTGDYEMTYNSKSKQPIDASELNKVLARILEKLTGQISNKIQKGLD